ncbi:gastrula zinc finger protein XlCGF52.1-like isoform X2 [Cylas formicarius]|uniref:gastrula zinc finger protein XlCGF52.1-like isoform X2 n=1 Tax=Cylas formicarius TaxID=197179 RepID=UPI002958C829|nr:gastrula zinc finger protein XlCGF52.1-like isoform X2 [Cylas formicarius]
METDKFFKSSRGFKNVKHLCKVCLGSHQKVLLNLKEELYIEGPYIWEAIEYVTSSKVSDTSIGEKIEFQVQPFIIEDNLEEFIVKKNKVGDNLKDMGEDIHEESVIDDVETIKIEIDPLFEENKKEEIQYKCNGCNKIYYPKKQFYIHSLKCPNPLKQEHIFATVINKLVAQCPICFKLLKSQKQVNHHIQNMHNRGSKQFVCKICGLIYNVKSALAYHTMTKHEEKTFTCKLCSKSFYREAFLKTHMDHHTKDIAKTVCTICGKKFHYKNSMFYHMKMHNRILNYNCKYCNKSYYSASCLKRHEVTHTRVRSYKCSECEKMFFSSSELKKHSFVHTNDKPFKCNFCRKGFASSYNFKMHLLTYSGDSPCELCHKTFINKEILGFHLKKKHKVVF